MGYPENASDLGFYAVHRRFFPQAAYFLDLRVRENTASVLFTFDAAFRPRVRTVTLTSRNFLRVNLGDVPAATHAVLHVLLMRRHVQMRKANT